jgi:hypothetical protein
VDRPPEETGTDKTLPIGGVGASAGGLDKTEGGGFGMLGKHRERRRGAGLHPGCLHQRYRFRSRPSGLAGCGGIPEPRALLQRAVEQGEAAVALFVEIAERLRMQRQVSHAQKCEALAQLSGGIALPRDPGDRVRKRRTR